MPRHNVARHNDTGSHNGADQGTIIGSAKRTFLNKALPARVGDAYLCPEHGLNAIRTGSSKVWVESRRLARVGSRTWCGATIDVGSPNVTDGSAEIDPFADPSCASGGFDLTCIPRIMMNEGWRVGAQLMMKWFNGKANDDYTSVPPDTTSVTLEWIETFERGQTAVAEISSPTKWFNQAAQDQLCKRLREAGLLQSDPTQFGDFTLPMRELHKQHMQSLTVGERDGDVEHNRLIFSGLEHPDDLDAALHNFALHAVARGTIAPESEGWLVTVEGVAIYGRDTYDFTNRDGEDQWLGRWDCEKGEWINALLFGTTVYNSDFEGHRQRTGQGGDFEIFTPLRELVLSQPYTTFCPARVHVP